MDFGLSDDQQLLMTSFEGLLGGYRTLPTGSHGYALYSDKLQSELAASGFLEVAAAEEFGPLEAALLTEEAATSPHCAEVAASALIGPLLAKAEGPIAVAWDVCKPARYLPVARTVCIVRGDDVLVATPGAGDVRTLDGVAAYPMGILERVPADAARLDGDRAAAVGRRALIGIAAEAAGLMRAALDSTVQYVKDRQQFGQPLGNFQAIQHRLAEDVQQVRACRWLALRAAFHDDDRNAAIACLYAQETMRKVIYDCHQFSGAMGLTLEFPLHLWTFRLKVLQGVAGGRGAQAAMLVKNVWGKSPVPASDLALVKAG
jgi:hypothetical protein